MYDEWPGSVRIALRDRGGVSSSQYRFPLGHVTDIMLSFQAKLRPELQVAPPHRGLAPFEISSDDDVVPRVGVQLGIS